MQPREFPVCPQCRFHEPFEHCWENSILCPLGMPPRSLDLYPIVRILAWLLAEMKSQAKS